MTEPHVHNRKLVSFMTLKSKMELNDLSPFFFLAGYLSLTKVQAMILQARQMKPKTRKLHSMPMFMLMALIIKGITRPPMPEPPEARPSANPLLLLNHRGAVLMAVYKKNLISSLNIGLE